MKKSRKLVALAMALTLLCGAVAMPAGAAESPEKTSGDFRYSVQADGTVQIDRYLGAQTELTVPAAIDGKPVTVIGVAAFGSKAAFAQETLTAVALPETVRVIGMQAFFRCKRLARVSLPENLQKISALAFADCENLEQITIPKACVAMHAQAFRGCKRLTIQIDKNNTAFRRKKDLILSKDGKTLVYCPPKTRFTVPNGVETIAQSVFEDTGLKTVVLPRSLKTIRANAFKNTKLKSVTLPKGIKRIQEGAFYGTQIRAVTLFGRVAQNAFGGCKKLKTVTLKAGTVLEFNPFFDSKALRAVYAEKRVWLGLDSLGIGPRGDKESHRKQMTLYGPKTGPRDRDFPKDLMTGYAPYVYAQKTHMRFVPLVSLKNATVKGVVDKTYTKAVKKSGAKQRVKVYLKGKALQKGRDYTVSYKHNKKRGKATVVITGTNRYDGTLKRTFKIR